jgi:hypothetical protein
MERDGSGCFRAEAERAKVGRWRARGAAPERATAAAAVERPCRAARRPAAADAARAGRGREGQWQGPASEVPPRDLAVRSSAVCAVLERSPRPGAPCARARGMPCSVRVCGRAGVREVRQYGAVRRHLQRYLMLLMQRSRGRTGPPRHWPAARAAARAAVDGPAGVSRLRPAVRRQQLKLPHLRGHAGRLGWACGANGKWADTGRAAPHLRPPDGTLPGGRCTHAFPAPSSPNALPPPKPPALPRPHHGQRRGVQLVLWHQTLAAVRRRLDHRCRSEGREASRVLERIVAGLQEHAQRRPIRPCTALAATALSRDDPMTPPHPMTTQ